MEQLMVGLNYVVDPITCFYSNLKFDKIILGVELNLFSRPDYLHINLKFEKIILGVGHNLFSRFDYSLS